MSETLINQNQINADEWQKPSDWIDISSGALPNSVYLLVGHKADYSALNNFGFNVVLSNTSNRFNVYIDYQLYGTYTSGTDVKISWSALALTSGQTTTSPIELTTHIVRITPEESSDTISSYNPVRVAASGHEIQGILWAHFAVDYALSNVAFARYNQVKNTYLTAITAMGDLLYISGNNISYLAGGEQYDLYTHKSEYLAKIPTIKVDSITAAGGAFNTSGPLKKVKVIVNNSFSQSINDTFSAMLSGKVTDFEINKTIVLSERTSNNDLFHDSSLKKLPTVDITKAENLTNFVTNNTNLKDTVFDASSGANLTRLTMYGSSATRMDGLKGLIVSNQAPFNHATSPQLNVSYTGLDRAALVNLFNSMPYNVGYTVVGSPTISSGVASGFSSSDYLSLPATMDISKNFEWVFCITTGDLQGDQRIFAYNTGTINSVYIQNKYLKWWITGDSSNILSTDALNLNTRYFIKCSNVNGLYSLSYSTDGITYTGLRTKELSLSTVISSYYDIGVNHTSYYSPFNGSIDLNNTYIKVNGVPWFRGTAAMTKTCDVRGCTGTADLTQTDKDIALDKGWSLTVA